jgi:uncharacterized protein (DUF736 family)
MRDYVKVGKGFLMRAENKRTAKAPDYTGKIEIDGGREIQVSGWVETSKSGKKYLSLALEEVNEEEEVAAPPRARITRDTMDDDIPF